MTDREFMLHAFKGRTDAVEFILSIAKMADTWDNLIDRDVSVSDDAINDMMFHALIYVPRNPFYREFFAELQPVIHAGMLNWLIANRIERAASPDRESLALSHVLRYSIADVALMSAALIGGDAWAAEVGVELRLRSQRDTLTNYVQEIEAIHAQNHSPL